MIGLAIPVLTGTSEYAEAQLNTQAQPKISPCAKPQHYILNNAQATIQPQTYTIACYLRISQEDESKDESNSISHQRRIIHRYIDEHVEFTQAKRIDYIDDGASGETTERAAYQRLLRDMKNGLIQCIVIKDLSRFGRSMLEVDDMLMNRLVTLGVRIIAIGEGYDSLRYPLSNLELAMVSLSNQFYNRDLAMKSKSAKLAKMKRGEHMAMPPFGYKKSMTKRHQLEIDKNTAPFIRMIFSLALEGNSVSEIARILNAQDIPTANVYQYGKDHVRKYKQREYRFSLWEHGAVMRVLRNQCYCGMVVGNRSMTVIHEKKHCFQRRKDEWIVVPDMHEPIVAKEDFEKVQALLCRRKMSKEPQAHIFQAKLICPQCQRTLKRSHPRNPRFKCVTSRYTDKAGCSDAVITQAEITKTVLSSIKTYTAVLIEQEELKLHILAEGRKSKTELERRLQSEQTVIKTMEESIAKHFMLFSSGEMSQEVFVAKKTAVSNALSAKKMAAEMLQKELEAITMGRSAVAERLTELERLMVIDELTHELVDLLIERIYVYDEKRVEIVWNGRFV